MSLLLAAERQLLEKRTFSFQEFMDWCFKCLNASPDLKEFIEGEAPQAAGVIATRVAGATQAMLLDPGLVMGDREFLQLNLVSGALRKIIIASGYEHTDHWLRLLGVHDTESLVALASTGASSYLKALTLLFIDTELPLDFSRLLQSDPVRMSLVLVCMLSSKPIVSEVGARNRERILACHEQMRLQIPLSVNHYVLVSSAWMLCSYASTPDKHAIKKTLNRATLPWLQRIGLKDAAPPPKAPPGERPTMVVAAEVMHSNHVQYRYFGQYLRQLRERFRLVLVTEDHQIDAHVSALFDETRGFKRGSQVSYLKDVAQSITEAQPEVVFWPSVGMRHWGPALANLRLAPMQLTALGHSASTFCDTMDYYLTETGYVSDPALFSERLILLPDASLKFERQPHQTFRPALPATPGPLIRIALPSNLLKLNPDFLAVLAEIRRRSQRSLEFHVFPNSSGLDLLSTRKVFDQVLPGSVVHPVLRYDQYLKRLNQCHLNLSPFPFGGLHSVIDSLKLGLPVVAMECPEPHGRTDTMLLRRLNLPEAWIARTVPDYILAALRLIENPSDLREAQQLALASQVDQVMFGDGHTPLGTHVRDAVWWVYQHHAALQASGDRRPITEQHYQSV